MLKRGCLAYCLLVVCALGLHEVRSFDLENEVSIDGKGEVGVESSLRYKRQSEGITPNVPRGTTPGEQCLRNCDGRPRTCFFRFHVERYSILGPACGNCSQGVQNDCFLPQCVLANGVQRGTVIINRQAPGPPINVCAGDRVVVEVHNEMPDESTAIHWHGIRQVDSPWMDGVPGVTQCGILPGTTFTYNFLVPKAGTFFYHSHVGSQKLEMINGALIVRLPKSRDVNGQYYDYDGPETTLVIQDFTNRPSTEYSPGINNESAIQLPNSVLINGLGREMITIEGNSRIDYRIPMTTITVEPGKRIRFRLIAAICMTCAYFLKINGHQLMAITVDGGNAFKPVYVDSIGFNSGERFDFVVNTNRSAGTYYIYVESFSPYCRGIRQVGLLHYRTAGVVNSFARVRPPPFGSPGLVLNNPNATCDGTNPTELCVTMLAGAENAPSVRSFNGNYYQSKIVVGDYVYNPSQLFGQYGVYPRYEEPTIGRLAVYTINNISNAAPPSPLLTQYGDIPPEDICKESCKGIPESQPPCTCTYIEPLSMGILVDIIMMEIDGEFNHPMHLHGYDFWVMAIGKLNPNLTAQANYKQLSTMALSDSFTTRQRVQRDSINVPSRGYAIVRIVTDNPGYWLFHCHFVFHLEYGMALIYKVGDDDQMLRPSNNFPRCGNYDGKTY